MRQALQFGMPIISRCDVPKSSLLARYVAGGGFADAYKTQVRGVVSQEQFVAAFYTSRLFRLERSILSWVARRPSTDDDVNALAAGRANTFAVWSVEARNEGELLLADSTGRTRSWLKTAAPVGSVLSGAGQGGSGASGTTLYFGSAITPRINTTTGEKSLGLTFTALLGFHKLYSRALLRAAAASLSR